MNRGKKIICRLLSALFCFVMLAVADSSEALAAVNCDVGPQGTFFYEVRLGPDDTIKNVRVYKDGKKTKDMEAKVTFLCKYKGWEYAYISYYAKKEGRYEIKYDLYRNGRRFIRETLTVDAYKDYRILSGITVDGKKVADRECVTSKSAGKVRFTPKPGWKIRSIKAISYGKNGQKKKQKFKNGSKIRFSKYLAPSPYDGDWFEEYGVTKFELTLVRKDDPLSTEYESFCVYRKR